MNDTSNLNSFNESQVNAYDLKIKGLIANEEWGEIVTLCDEYLKNTQHINSQGAERAKLYFLVEKGIALFKLKLLDLSEDCLAQSNKMASRLDLDLYSRCSIKIKYAITLSENSKANSCANMLMEIYSLCNKEGKLAIFYSAMLDFLSQSSNPANTLNAQKQFWLLTTKL